MDEQALKKFYEDLDRVVKIARFYLPTGLVIDILSQMGRSLQSEVEIINDADRPLPSGPGPVFTEPKPGVMIGPGVMAGYGAAKR